MLNIQNKDFDWLDIKCHKHSIDCLKSLNIFIFV